MMVWLNDLEGYLDYELDDLVLRKLRENHEACTSNKQKLIPICDGRWKIQPNRWRGQGEWRGDMDSFFMFHLIFLSFFNYFNQDWFVFYEEFWTLDFFFIFFFYFSFFLFFCLFENEDTFIILKDFNGKNELQDCFFTAFT